MTLSDRKPWSPPPVSNVWRSHVKSHRAASKNAQRINSPNSQISFRFSCRYVNTYMCVSSLKSCFNVQMWIHERRAACLWRHHSTNPAEFTVTPLHSPEPSTSRLFFFSFPVTCCLFFLSVNYHWRKQPPVCGELRLAMCFLKWKAEGCGNPHAAPVNQLLPLLLRSLRHSRTSWRLETVSLGARRAYPMGVTSDSAKLWVSRSNLRPLTFCFE